MNSKNNNLLEGIEQKSTVFLDLYLEFFGIFIPGFVLVFGSCSLISLCHYCFYGHVSFCGDWFAKINVSYGFFFLLICSYAFGAILHRQRAAVPDERAAYYEWRHKKRKHAEYNGAANFIDNLPISMLYVPLFALKQNHFVKYPYKNLRRYLIEHNLTHLLIFVPWCGQGVNTDYYASRTIINELKTIIRFLGPKEFSLDLTKAESNIRMFTALWYAFKYLIRINFVCLLITIPVTLWDYPYRNFDLTTREDFQLLCGSLIFLLIFIFLYNALQGIEKFLHYLRVKEIVTILSQANLLRHEYPEKAIWNDLNEKDKRFKQFLQNMQPMPCINCKYSEECSYLVANPPSHTVPQTPTQNIVPQNNNRRSCERVYIEITDNSTNITN